MTNARSTESRVDETQSTSPEVCISNPEVPLRKPEVLQAKKLWEFGGDDDEEGSLFGIIMGLTADAAGNVYLVDNQLSQVIVISAAGRYIRTIGREGEGPGDLRRPISAFVPTEGKITVVISIPSKLIQYTREGEYVGTVILEDGLTGKNPKVSRIVAAGTGYIAGSTEIDFEKGNEVITQYLCSLDFTGREIVRYWEGRHVLDLNKPVYEERSQSLRGRWTVTMDNVIYVASSFEDYVIEQYDIKGDMKRVIRREYKHRPRSRDERQAIHDWATAIPNSLRPGTVIQVESHDKDIMALYTGPDGNCWVLTSRGQFDRPKGAIGVFDVFDRDGQYTRQVTIMGDGDPYRDRLYFIGDRLYVVTSYLDSVLTYSDAQNGEKDSLLGEPKPMTVVCYDIGAN